MSQDEYILSLRNVGVFRTLTNALDLISGVTTIEGIKQRKQKLEDRINSELDPILSRVFAKHGGSCEHLFVDGDTEFSLKTTQDGAKEIQRSMLKQGTKAIIRHPSGYPVMTW